MQTSVNTTAPRIFRLARLVIAISPILAAAATVSHADAQLAGDECSNAIVAVAGANGPVANTSYTLSANPPENNGECQFLNWTSFTRDVWWVFDAPVAGKLTLEFCASTFDTSVVVYRGANAADCDANGELDGCQIAAGTVPDANNNGVPDTCETPFTACPGDFDGNNTVSGSDLGALLGSWGPCPPGAVGDMDSNGVVNGADLGALLGAWGSCDS